MNRISFGEEPDFIDPYIGEMHTIWSSQYGQNCVVAYPRNSADQLIAHCRHMGAVRTSDGEEFVVALRHDIGPELWTEAALRASIRARAALAGADR